MVPDKVDDTSENKHIQKFGEGLLDFSITGNMKFDAKFKVSKI